MKGVAVGAVLVMLGAPPLAAAEDYTIEDEAGRRLGRVEAGTGDELVVRDAHGRRAVSIDDPGIGHATIYDRSGRRIGTIEAGPADDLVVRDASGRSRLRLESNDGVDGYVVRDRNGRRIGTVERWP